MFSRLPTLRGTAGVAIGVGAAAAALLGTSATAAAEPPNCTAADLAGVQAGVSASLSAYLFTHPEVNEFYNSLKGLPSDQLQARVHQYGEANPQASDEVKAIRQPLVDFGNRCGANPADLSGLPQW